VHFATYMQKCLARLEDYPVTLESQMFFDKIFIHAPVNCKVTYDINTFYNINFKRTIFISSAVQRKLSLHDSMK